METVSLNPIDIGGFTERSEMSKKTEKYYRAIIELAQKKQIPVIVVIAPYAGINKEQQAYFNKAFDIATDYNASFINCNLLFDDIGLDFTKDVADQDHLNYRGNQKFSRYIGHILKEKYIIPDCRGDERYSSWQRHAEYIRQTYYK